MELYVDAMKVHQTILDTVQLKKCSKELIARNESDCDTRALIASAWYEAGLIDSAKKYYLEASSLTENAQQRMEFREMVRNMALKPDGAAISLGERLSSERFLSEEQLEKMLKNIAEKQ